MSVIYDLTVGVIERLKRSAGLITVKTHTFYARKLDRNSTVLDLGANVGEFSTTLANSFGSHIYAIEAFPAVFAQIPDLPAVKKFQLAIAADEGPISLFASDNQECGSVHRSIASNYGLVGQELCSGVTFEHFLRQNSIRSVNLLKIDIEGSEEVLFKTTADETLLRMDQITIEFHDFVPGSITARTVRDICKRVKSLGFFLLPFSYVYPDMPTADFLFIRLSACEVGLFDRACFFALRIVLWLQLLKSIAVRRWIVRRPKTWS